MEARFEDLLVPEAASFSKEAAFIRPITGLPPTRQPQAKNRELKRKAPAVQVPVRIPPVVRPPDLIILSETSMTLPGRLSLRSLKGISLWLLPSPEGSNILRALIQGCSVSLGSPVFEPHVTLLGESDKTPAFLAKLVRDIAAARLPLRLRFGRIEASADAYRSLYLSVKRNAGLDTMAAALRRQAGGKSAGDFFPHLSLCYGAPAPEDRSVLNRSWKSADRIMVFDRIAVVATEGQPPDWQILEIIRTPSLKNRNRRPLRK